MGYIYKITNTLNGKCYIGKTTENSITKRISRHFTGSGSSLLKVAINKHGRDAFTIDILHKDVPNNEIDTLEAESISIYNSVSPNGYNLIRPFRGVKKHSPTSRIKMSKAHKGKKRKPLSETTKAKISKSNLGKKRTPEQRKRISEAHMGLKGNMLGKTQSPESRQKMSVARLKLTKSERPEAFCFLKSLPDNTSLSDMRAILREKYPHRNHKTIYNWVSIWSKKP